MGVAIDLLPTMLIPDGPMSSATGRNAGLTVTSALTLPPPQPAHSKTSNRAAAPSHALFAIASSPDLVTGPFWISAISGIGILASGTYLGRDRIELLIDLTYLSPSPPHVILSRRGAVELCLKGKPAMAARPMLRPGYLEFFAASQCSHAGNTCSPFDRLTVVLGLCHSDLLAFYSASQVSGHHRHQR